MASPTRYNMTYDFTGFQSANPNTPLPADKVEIEFINLERTTGETITNLNLLQRSDGKLQNKIVEFETLSDSTKALIGSPITPRGNWEPNTGYQVLDLVTVGNTTYIAVVEHASFTSFAVDLQAERWQLWANPGFVDGTSFFQKFSGDGTTTVFTVSQDMGTDENGLMIFINNSGWIPQDPANFTINGTTLTFLSAPPNASNNVFVFAPAKILSQAAAYAVSAGTSAASASTSAGNASNSATAAANSATAAAASATSASGSASASGTSASQAATSATNASNSATAAANSVIEAQEIVNSIAPRNVFNKAVDPTADDDIIAGYSEGSMWVNTVDKTFFVCVDDSVGAAVWSTGGGGGAGDTSEPRFITSGDTATFVNGDNVIAWKSAATSDKTLTLGAALITQTLMVKDAQGTAGTYPITISASGCTIDGAASYVIDNNNGAISFKWDGTSNWMVF